MRQPIQLSEREKDVIKHLLQGKGNKQIALDLGISNRTVEFHLTNVYAKLGVNSRSEAILKLTEKDLRESTGSLPEKSTVESEVNSSENDSKSILRRIAMKKMYPILGILLATLFVAEILSFRGFPPSIEPQLPTMTTINSVTVLPYTPTQNQTETSTPTVSVKEHILEQIRQLAAEYDQAVQAEKQHGIVEYSQDPTTGEDIFLFLGDSFISISNLNIEFHTKMNDLINLYTQIYRDETNPTPFPTPVLEEQRQPYLDFLYEQTKSYCSNQDMNAQNATVIFYDPGDGKYHPLLIDEALARCYLYGWMIEEWRTAPQLARLDKAVDMTLIRQTTGNPGLTLTFQSVSEVPNAPWRSAALYRDETGTSYYVDIDTARLSAIEPSLLGEPNITSAEKKNIDELRGIARQFAFINSPRLTELESVLLYEENCKDEICFFRWDYRNRNWSGTDWAMMAPFLQVGVLTDGKIIAYNNTLDLFQ